MLSKSIIRGCAMMLVALALGLLPKGAGPVHADGTLLRERPARSPLTTNGTFSASAAAERIEIHFNDPAGLLAIPGDCSRSSICSGAPFTEANFYKEDGMLFTDGVNPPDPRLGVARRYLHYHLNYEDEDIKFGFVQGNLRPGRQTPAGFVPLAHPENENRTLGPMGNPGGTVIQMIYDPNNDGVPDPFNLISLVVYKGKLNVGINFSTEDIGVYNNLTGGFEWFLIGANNLTRATLEVPLDFDYEGMYTIDKIVFEPSSPRILTTTSPQPQIETTNILEEETNPVELDNVLHDVRDSVLFELVNLAAPAFAALDIEKAGMKLRGPARDQFQVSGSLDLGAESDGVDVLNEAVIVTFGMFREMIPVGLFRCSDAGKRKCIFNDTSGGITNMRITIAEDTLQFQVKAKGLHLSGISPDSPVPFSLQIGDDMGVVHIHPDKISSSDEALEGKLPNP